MASRSTPISEKEIAASFARIEEELIASMMRNFKRHQVEEAASGFKWQQWQAEQLASLNEYTKKNLKTYGRQFDKLNKQIERLVEASYIRAGKAEDARIRDAVDRGFRPTNQMAFFQVPEERLNALVGATHSDMMKAEYAVLRRSTDIYRSTIFDAQVYAQSGAGTYAQAIDMATKDFLAKGIDGIVYSNGSRHTIREYSQMAIRTSTKRATFAAEGDMRGEWGVHTIIVNYRDDACPECMEWVGEVLIDDVYSGGSSKDGDYSLLSEAMDAGLFHPNCRDTSTTYFPGVTNVPDRPSKAAQSRAEAREEVEQLENTAENNERRYERLREYSLDPENKARYEAKADEWEERHDTLGSLTVDVDKIVPCLERTADGEIVDTEVERISRRAASKYTEDDGWYINWGSVPQSVDVYKLTVAGESEAQGLIGLSDDKQNRAVSLHWGVAAPQNQGLIQETKKYEGVGGHLFAIAAQKSVDMGYNGFMTGKAANSTLLQHYIEEYGATQIGRTLNFYVDEKAAAKLLEAYTWKKK